MLKCIQRIFFVFVVTILIASLQTDKALAAGEFTKTCVNMNISAGGGLEAVCLTRNQEPSLTGLNINNRIANINGALTWRRNGNYVASCQSCSVGQIDAMQRTALRCICNDTNGLPQNTQLDLDERIANIDGQLTYERPTQEHDEL